MMAVVSSHILDSVSGGSAAGIRCELFRLQADSSKQVVFDVIADAEGRISERWSLTIQPSVVSLSW